MEVSYAPTKPSSNLTCVKYLDKNAHNVLLRAAGSACASAASMTAHS